MSDDLIRRSDAIKALGEEPYVWSDNDELARGGRNQWIDDVNALKAVPSADRPSEIIYGNEHNCMMTIFGECSYAETGCGDCAVVEKIRKALSADRPSAVDLSNVYSTAYKSGYEKGKVDRPQGEWLDYEIPSEDGGAMPIQVCSLCKTFYPLAYTGGGHRFCPNCGAKMKGADE